MAKRIPINELAEGMIVEQGIYLGDEDRTALVGKNAVLTNYLIEKLKSRGVKDVQVITDKRPSGLIELPPPKPVIDPRLRRDAIISLKEMFAVAELGESELHNSAKAVKQVDMAVQHLVLNLTKDKRALVNIRDLKSFDDYTYHHSLSVTVLAVAIAQEMGMSSKNLNLIGKCGMLHDIGKTAIPIEIINKKAKLSDDEFSLIQNHSPEGYYYLARRHIGAEELWEAVMFHHEKFDGSGYPKGLKEEEIPLMSRIISVADVYDALTSNRPYRMPMQPAEAVEYIMAGVGTSFDYDVVVAFINKLELYPLGSFVELSNGKIAVVLSNDFPLRPVVQMMDTGEIFDLYNDWRHLSLTIKRVFTEPAATSTAEDSI
ncbi:MAG: HD-GYP domain-containing protein [Peptococcaceae bacterium]|jgi:putative nucleotidyltransferase with HDIG domain|nr:HD-GYP domain-containing protein [Peptococcaceae bacterium]